MTKKCCPTACSTRATPQWVRSGSSSRGERGAAGFSPLASPQGRSLRGQGVLGGIAHEGRELRRGALLVESREDLAHVLRVLAALADLSFQGNVRYIDGSPCTFKDTTARKRQPFYDRVLNLNAAAQNAADRLCPSTFGTGTGTERQRGRCVRRVRGRGA